MSILKNRPLERLEIDALTESEMDTQLIENKRRFLPELTDENVSGQTMRFIKYIVKFCAKWIRSFAETILNEAFLPTASRYETINLHARANGYQVSPITGSTAMVTCTLKRTQSLGIIMNREDMRFQTKTGYGVSPVTFEVATDTFVIPSGVAGDEFYLDLVQGTTIKEEVLGTSNGESFQQFETTQGFVVGGTAVVEVEEYDDSDELVWVQFVETDNMLLNDYDDRVYEIIQYTEDGKLIIGFGSGDGISAGHGKIPDSDRQIRITYRVIPEDQNGDVAADTIVRTYPSTGIFDVTNVEAADGYVAREDLPTIRWKAMRQPRISESIHKEEDFVAAAEAIDGCGRAYAIPRLYGDNTMAVFFVDSDGEAPDGDDVYEWEQTLESLNSPGEAVCGSSVVFQDFTVVGILEIADNYLAATVIAAAEDALEARFNPLGYDADGNRLTTNGMAISPSLISNVVTAVAGVTGFTLSAPAATIYCDGHKLPRLTSIGITES